MLVNAYGVGVDSTALLIGQVKRGIRPQYILTADTGGEKPETYAYLYTMQQFLEREGFPSITLVRLTPRIAIGQIPYATLEEACLTNQGLPSIAFGFQSKTCSERWKQRAQHHYLKKQADIQAVWKTGRRVTKYIGFDNSPQDRKRTYKVNANDKHYATQFPLIEWGWSRERCIEEIKSVGLPVPLKSACFFCPASQTWEIRRLPKHLLRQIVIMEARAEPRLNSIKGLWGTGRKGTRGGERKPGSMTVFIREEGLLPAAEIDWLRENVPTEILNNQTRFAQGEAILSWSDFFADLEARAPWKETDGHRTTSNG